MRSTTWLVTQWVLAAGAIAQSVSLVPEAFSDVRGEKHRPRDGIQLPGLTTNSVAKTLQVGSPADQGKLQGPVSVDDH